MKKILLCISLISSPALTTHCLAQAGTLDLFFAVGGVAVSNISISGFYDDGGRSLAVQSDGRFVMGGWSKNASNWDFGFVRYNPNGSLDLNFSVDGKYTIDVGNGNDFCQSINLLSDNSIIAAGTIDAGTYDEFAVYKILPGGILDSLWGIDGHFYYNFGFTNSYCYGSYLQADGKILAAGTTNNAGNFEFAMVRVNANGTIDNTFGTAGKVTTDISFADDWAFSVRVLPDGSILVAGYAYNGADYDFAIVKYHSDGSLDTSFGSGGIRYIDYNSYSDIGIAMEVMTNGKILLGGYTGPAGDKDFLVARLDANGSLDPTFDGDGWAITSLGSYDDNLYSMKLQTDGKFIAAGSTSNGSNLDMAVVRFNADGSLDNTFGVGGIFRLDIDGGDDIAWSVKLVMNNKILVGGETWGGRADYNFAVIQLNNDPVNIDEHSLTSAASVYPNPFSSSVTVSFNEFIKTAKPVSASLFDYTGKEILRRETSEAELRLNTENLAEGFYLLRVGEENFKVVKGN
jgi:uncharacterized delta-60 repeat protein